MSGTDSIKYATQQYPGDGSTVTWDFNFAGGYISQSHVKAKVTGPDGVDTDTAFTWSGPNTIQVTPAISVGSTITIYRDTPKDKPIANFSDGAVVSEVNLDTNADQAVFVAAEAADRSVDVLDRALTVPVTEVAPVVPPPRLNAGKFLTAVGDGSVAWAAGTGTDTGFRTDLANPALGAKLMGVRRESGLIPGTAAAKFSEIPSIRDLPWNATGLTDDTNPVLAAQTDEARLFVPEGTFSLQSGTELKSRFVGPGVIKVGGRITNMLDVEAGLHTVIGDDMVLGDERVFHLALRKKVCRVAFISDSIGRGYDNVAPPDAAFRLLMDAMQKAAPDVQFVFGNFSISGRAYGELNDDAYTGVSSDTYDPTAHFNEVDGSTLPIPDPSKFPGGTTAGLAWHAHVQAFAPDKLILWLGINGNDPRGMVGSATSFINNRVKFWPKVPSITVCSPTLPTRDDPTWAGREKTVRATALGLMSMARHVGATAIDINRRWLLFRDGVDVARQQFQVFSDFTDFGNWALLNGTAPTVSSSVISFGTDATAVRQKTLHRDFSIGCTVSGMSGSKVAGIIARCKPTSTVSSDGYVLQIQRSVPQVVLYYNDSLTGVSTTLGSGAIAAKSSYKLVLEGRGADFRVLVDGVESFTVTDCQQVEDGHCGFFGDAGVTISAHQRQLGYTRTVGPQTLSDKQLVGPTDDSDPLGVRGNGMNHPSMAAHFHICFGSLLSLVRLTGYLRLTPFVYAQRFQFVETATPVSGGDNVQPIIAGLGPVQVAFATGSDTAMTTPIGAAAWGASNRNVKAYNGKAPVVKLRKDNSVTSSGADVINQTLALDFDGPWEIDATADISSFGANHRNILTIKATLVA